jgi:nitrite reductase/ring-hydroxylating ferredoxin subunit
MNVIATDRVQRTPPGVQLCPLDWINDGASRNFVLQMRNGRFHGFVLRRGDRVVGYADRCPHQGLPLAQKLDDYLTPNGKYLICSWHGALFDPEDGRCVGGPCVGAGLTPWPVEVRDGAIFTATDPMP